MSIKIKTYDKKWRIEIIDEEWEFETSTRMKEVLLELIEFKELYGKVK